jgi:hypothetical protein
MFEGMDDDEPVVAAQFLTRAEAEVARARLEAAGIRSFIQADDAGGMYGAMELGRVRLFVRRVDLARAQAELEG